MKRAPENIIRVFPQRTASTPDDPLAFIGPPPLPFMRPKAAEVHVSCVFTWDIRTARRLAASWGRYYDNVSLGGPAMGPSPGEFTPGLYVRQGCVITSRGCPNACYFCLVPKREGSLRVLPIVDGNDVMDNNLLACPRPHVEAVLDMLGRQKARARFTGGLEARRVSPWFCKALSRIRLDIAYTAYDRPSDQIEVERAIGRLRDAHGWTNGTARRRLGCYVLVGYPGDTLPDAVRRLEWVVSIGAQPFPMYYRPDGTRHRREPVEWRRTLRQFIRPYLTPRKVAAGRAEGR